MHIPSTPHHQKKLLCIALKIHCTSLANLRHTTRGRYSSMPRGKFLDPEDDEAAIAELLASSKTIAVVGLSSKQFRPSFGVSQYLQSAGYRIIPVNPNAC